MVVPLGVCVRLYQRGVGQWQLVNCITFEKVDLQSGDYELVVDPDSSDAMLCHVTGDGGAAVIDIEGLFIQVVSQHCNGQLFVAKSDSHGVVRHSSLTGEQAIFNRAVTALQLGGTNGNS